MMLVMTMLIEKLQVVNGVGAAWRTRDLVVDVRQGVTRRWKELTTACADPFLSAPQGFADTKLEE